MPELNGSMSQGGFGAGHEKKVPPPPTKPRPKANSIGQIDKAAIKKSKPPVPTPGQNVPSNGSASRQLSTSPVPPDGAASPKKKSRPPPPARNQSLAAEQHGPADGRRSVSPEPAGRLHIPNTSPTPARKPPPVLAKPAATASTASDKQPVPPPTSEKRPVAPPTSEKRPVPPPTSEKRPVPPPTSEKRPVPPPTSEKRPVAPPSPLARPAPSHQTDTSVGSNQPHPPPPVKPAQRKPPAIVPKARSQSVSTAVQAVEDHEKNQAAYNEIEDLISNFYDELETEDFFFKAQLGTS